MNHGNASPNYKTNTNIKQLQYLNISMFHLCVVCDGLWNTYIYIYIYIWMTSCAFLHSYINKHKTVTTNMSIWAVRSSHGLGTSEITTPTTTTTAIATAAATTGVRAGGRVGGTTGAREQQGSSDALATDGNTTNTSIVPGALFALALEGHEGRYDYASTCQRGSGIHPV